MRNTLKRILFFSMAVISLCVFTDRAEALEATHVCDILSINAIDDGSCTIGVLNENATKSTVLIPAGQENKMLAIALTAFSMGQKIKARFDATAKQPVFLWIRIYDDTL